MIRKKYEPVKISPHIFNDVDIVCASGLDEPIKIDDDYIAEDIY